MYMRLHVCVHAYVIALVCRYLCGSVLQVRMSTRVGVRVRVCASASACAYACASRMRMHMCMVMDWDALCCTMVYRGVSCCCTLRCAALALKCIAYDIVLFCVLSLLVLYL